MANPGQLEIQAEGQGVVMTTSAMYPALEMDSGGAEMLTAVLRDMDPIRANQITALLSEGIQSNGYLHGDTSIAAEPWFAGRYSSHRDQYPAEIVKTRTRQTSTFDPNKQLVAHTERLFQAILRYSEAQARYWDLLENSQRRCFFPPIVEATLAIYDQMNDLAPSECELLELENGRNLFVRGVAIVHGQVLRLHRMPIAEHVIVAGVIPPSLEEGLPVEWPDLRCFLPALKAALGLLGSPLGATVPATWWDVQARETLMSDCRAEPPYLGVRFHAGRLVSRDGYDQMIEISAPQQYAIFRFFHAGGYKGRTLSEIKEQPFYHSLRSEKNKIRNLLIPLNLDLALREHKVIDKDRSSS